MSLYDELVADVRDALSTDLADAVTSFTVQSYDSNLQVFDPATGDVTRSASPFVLSGVLVENTEKNEAAVAGSPNYYTLLCVNQDIIDSGYTVKMNDVLVDPNGVEFTVYSYIYDPLKATIILGLKGGT